MRQCATQFSTAVRRSIRATNYCPWLPPWLASLQFHSLSRAVSSWSIERCRSAQSPYSQRASWRVRLPRRCLLRHGPSCLVHNLRATRDAVAFVMELLLYGIIRKMCIAYELENYHQFSVLRASLTAYLRAHDLSCCCCSEEQRLLIHDPETSEDATEKEIFRSGAPPGKSSTTAAGRALHSRTSQILEVVERLRSIRTQMRCDETPSDLTVSEGACVSSPSAVELWWLYAFWFDCIWWSAYTEREHSSDLRGVLFSSIIKRKRVQSTCFHLEAFWSSRCKFATSSSYQVLLHTGTLLTSCQEIFFYWWSFLRAISRLIS